MLNMSGLISHVQTHIANYSPPSISNFLLSDERENKRVSQKLNSKLCLKRWYLLVNRCNQILNMILKHYLLSTIFTMKFVWLKTIQPISCRSSPNFLGLILSFLATLFFLLCLSSAYLFDVTSCFSTWHYMFAISF